MNPLTTSRSVRLASFTTPLSFNHCCKINHHKTDHQYTQLVMIKEIPENAKLCRVPCLKLPLYWLFTKQVHDDIHRICPDMAQRYEAAFDDNSTCVPLILIKNNYWYTGRWVNYLPRLYERTLIQVMFKLVQLIESEYNRSIVLNFISRNHEWYNPTVYFNY